MSFIKYKKLLGVVFGALIIGVGIGLCERSGLGADPITVLYAGLSKKFNLSIGNASWLVAIISAMIALMIDKQQIGIGTFITPFLTKVGIDLCHYIGVSTKPLQIYSFFIIGLLLIAIGIAMMIRINLGKGSNDALISALAYRFDRKYYEIRWVLDCLYLLIGVVLGGSITIGTVIATLILGKLIDYFTNFQYMWKKAN